MKELPTLSGRRGVSWVRLILGLGLGIGIFAYVAKDIDWAAIQTTITTLRPFYALCGLILVFLTIVVRAWRWSIMFRPPGIVPTLPSVFWSLTLGQMLNLILPFRMGDVARLLQLERYTQAGISRILATMVVEKALDITALGVSLLAVLPLLPTFMGGSPWLTAAATLLSLSLLYLLAYQGEALIRLNQKIEPYLPAFLAQRTHRWLVAGLGGLDALRYQQANLYLLTLTFVIAVMSIMTPLVIFAAVRLPLGLGEAVVLHVVLTVGSVPPTTPLKMGVFEGLVVFLLQQMGVLDDAAAFTFAFLWHISLIGPQVFLGSLAAAHRNKFNLQAEPN